MIYWSLTELIATVDHVSTAETVPITGGGSESSLLAPVPGAPTLTASTINDTTTTPVSSSDSSTLGGQEIIPNESENNKSVMSSQMNELTNELPGAENGEIDTEHTETTEEPTEERSRSSDTGDECKYDEKALSDIEMKFIRSKRLADLEGTEEASYSDDDLKFLIQSQGAKCGNIKKSETLKKKWDNIKTNPIIWKDPPLQKLKSELQYIKKSLGK